MPRRAAQALLGAAIGVALLVLLWALALHVPAFEHADLSILQGFSDLRQRPHVGNVAFHIASLCDPSPYVYLAAVPLLAALLRRRGWLAVAIFAILLGANETTQLLKPLLEATRPAIRAEGPASLATGSWPSGHATAAMSLALCCVLAAPARWRPWVAAAGSAFSVAVCYSFLSLGWHYPSDVIGGFLVAGTWTCLGIAAMLELGGRKAERQAAEPRRLPWRSALAPPVLALLGALVLAALILLARPHQVVGYAHLHHAFVIGAAVIAALALALATGLMLVTTRLGSDPAATAAPSPGSPPGRG
jgi:membrane-associated phospholipid phosphatase